jgi:FkbM family methyltransferase
MSNLSEIKIQEVINTYYLWTFKVLLGMKGLKCDDNDNILLLFGNEIVDRIIPPNDIRSIPLEILNLGDHESSELNIQKKLVNSCHTIFDIGANHGWYSLEMSKAFPNKTVIAFEAVPATFQLFKSNLALNNDLKNIQAFQTALSNEVGEASFFYNPNLSVNASFQNLQNSDLAEQITVKTETLDQFCIQHNISPDFIKCDVEGAELHVFQGAEKTLSKYQPVICTEMLRKWSNAFNYHPNEIIKFLAILNYQCFAIKQDLHTIEKIDIIDENTQETNFIFMPKSKLSLLKELGLLSN